MIESFFMKCSILVLTENSDNHFNEVWIVELRKLILFIIKASELNRCFEIDLVQVDWILSIEPSLDRESGNCWILPLLQLDKFQQCIVEHCNWNHDTAEGSQNSFYLLVSFEVKRRDGVGELIQLDHLTEKSILSSKPLAYSFVLHFSISLW